MKFPCCEQIWTCFVKYKKIIVYHRVFNLIFLVTTYGNSLLWDTLQGMLKLKNLMFYATCPWVWYISNVMCAVLMCHSTACGQEAWHTCTHLTEDSDKYPWWYFTYGILPFPPICSKVRHDTVTVNELMVMIETFFQNSSRNTVVEELMIMIETFFQNSSWYNVVVGPQIFLFW